MHSLRTRPTWLTALLPLLAVWQYGDRGSVRGELYRMALAADAAADSEDALKRIADVLDRDTGPAALDRDQLRDIARAALAGFERVPASAPEALTVERRGEMH